MPPMLNRAPKTKLDAFVAEYFKNNSNQTKALLCAQPHLKYSAANTIAQRYMKNEYVISEIERLRKQIETKSEITIEKKTKLLWEIAKEKGKNSVPAISELNKMQGHYATQKVDVTSGGSPLTVILLPDNHRGDFDASGDE